MASNSRSVCVIVKWYKLKRHNFKMSFSAERKPHAVFSPFPIQGHINPLFKLAKLLHLRGFHITFVHTEHNHKLLLKSRGLNALEDFFCFESILDGVPPNNDDNLDATHHVVSLCESIREKLLPPFLDLLSRLNHSATA